MPPVPPSIDPPADLQAERGDVPNTDERDASRLECLLLIRSGRAPQKQPEH